MSGNRIETKDHLDLPWVVHHLAPDFEIEDVWRMPVGLRPEDNLADFWDQMQLAIAEMSPRTIAAILFRIRFALGRVFGWDQRPNTRSPMELLRRYADETGADAGPNKAGDFSLVYALENEYLAEIENGTVQAALHLGRTPPDTHGISGVNLTVYVKPKGALGRLYMHAIKPFRLWFVYPSILKATGRQWESFRSG